MTSIAITALVGFFVYGTASAATLPASWTDQKVEYPTYQVAMTGYNAVPGQTDDTPEITASGAFSNPDIIAARSRDLAAELPFGTVIAVTAASSSPKCGYDLVEGLVGLRVIADTMNARMHNKVDILFDTEDRVKVGGKSTSAARTLGVCNVEIAVVGHVDPAKIPASQLELQAALGPTPFAGK